MFAGFMVSTLSGRSLQVFQTFVFDLRQIAHARGAVLSAPDPNNAIMILQIEGRRLPNYVFVARGPRGMTVYCHLNPKTHSGFLIRVTSSAQVQPRNRGMLSGRTI